jgi:hypothetical protein
MAYKKICTPEPDIHIIILLKSFLFQFVGDNNNKGRNAEVIMNNKSTKVSCLHFKLVSCIKNKQWNL